MQIQQQKPQDMAQLNLMLEILLKQQYNKVTEATTERVIITLPFVILQPYWIRKSLFFWVY